MRRPTNVATSHHLLYRLMREEIEDFLSTPLEALASMSAIKNPILPVRSMRSRFRPVTHHQRRRLMLILGNISMGSLRDLLLQEFRWSRFTPHQLRRDQLRQGQFNQGMRDQVNMTILSKIMATPSRIKT